jgi:signal transduction histidine kinase
MAGPAAVGGGILTATVILWQALLAQDRFQLQRTVQYETDRVAQATLTRVPVAAPYLGDLADGWAQKGPPPEEQWRDQVQRLIRGDPGCRAIGWVDVEGRMRWVVPAAGNQGIVGLDLTADSRCRERLQRARDNDEVAVLPSLELPPGGRVVLALVPIGSGSRFGGFIAGAFDSRQHLGRLLRDVAPGFSFAVSDADGELYQRGEWANEAEWGAEHEITFYQADWRVRVWPGPERLAKERSPFPRVALAGGCLLAVLLASIVYLAQAAHARARELEALNGDLTREIAERSGLEEQLRQAHKMEAVGRLAGGVAHEFNNLMTVVLGYSDLALATLPPDHPCRAFTDHIRKAGERAASLTAQLLAFGRKSMLQPVVLDPNAVVAGAEALLRPLIGEHIQLVTCLAPGLRRVNADPGQLEQALLNLALNARDAMPSGGQLTFRTANARLDASQVQSNPEVCPGEYVLLEVTDTGCGMDETTRAHLFEPFFTTKGLGQGTGLGLATVYGIVKQSGGHIEASSEPGNGSSFRIYLPAVDDNVAAPSQPANSPERTMRAQDPAPC